MRVLMLVSDAHGGHGGIAQYNRDVITALAGLDWVSELVVLPRLIDDPDFNLPDKVRYDRAAASGLPTFIRRAISAAMADGPFDLVFCGHINLMPVAAIAKWMTGARLVLAVHGTEAWHGDLRWSTRMSLAAADTILSVSQFTIARMASWHPAVLHLGRVVPNTFRGAGLGPGPRDEALSARLGLTGKRVIMTLGRMAANERAKGFDEIIALMPALLCRRPDLVYLCAGDGDDRPRLEAKAAELGLQGTVVFCGAVPEAQKAEFYRLADAFVMASHGEGFGIVLLEAMACGIPVLGSTADATCEALRHGALGPSVDPHNPEALAEGILAAIDSPTGVPAGLAHYSFDQFQVRLADALGELVGKAVQPQGGH